MKFKNALSLIFLEQIECINILFDIFHCQTPPTVKHTSIMSDIVIISNAFFDFVETDICTKISFSGKSHAESERKKRKERIERVCVSECAYSICLF